MLPADFDTKLQKFENKNWGLSQEKLIWWSANLSISASEIFQGPGSCFKFFYQLKAFLTENLRSLFNSCQIALIISFLLLILLKKKLISLLLKGWYVAESMQEKNLTVSTVVLLEEQTSVIFCLQLLLIEKQTNWC